MTPKYDPDSRTYRLIERYLAERDQERRSEEGVRLRSMSDDALAMFERVLIKAGKI